MTKYYWLIVAVGVPALALYLRRGWQEFMAYKQRFWTSHPMRHSANYRLTDLWVAGIGVILLWPLGLHDDDDRESRTGTMLDNAFLWLARQIRKLKRHQPGINGNHA